MRQIRLNESEINRLILEAVKKTLSKENPYVIGRSDNIIPDNIYKTSVPGDSLPMTSDEPGEHTPWKKGADYLKDKQLRTSCLNILTQLEYEGRPYDLEVVARDLSLRYDYDFQSILKVLRDVYQKYHFEGATLNENRIRKIVREAVKKVLKEDVGKPKSIE